MAPSEAWGLDFAEVYNLLELKSGGTDTSIMLNYERVNNGADKKWLHQQKA